MIHSKFGCKRTKLASLISFVIATTASTQVFSQDTEAQEAESIERIEVTGSRIPRVELESISPLAVIEREVLDQTGTLFIEDIIKSMPQNFPGFDKASNNPGNGTVNINLRGLGSNRSLVLIDGNRLGNSDSFGVVDVNQIPAALIERVEIISGGASSVYGSDAIAGAVNFIMKKDFEGLSIDANYAKYEEGDGEDIELTMAYGHSFANGRGDVSLYAGYIERGEVLQVERPWTNQVLFDDPRSGTFIEGGSRISTFGTLQGPPALLGGEFLAPGTRITFRGNDTPVVFDNEIDIVNFAADSLLQIPLERFTGGLFANYELTDSTLVKFELMYANTTVDRQLAPDPFFLPITINTDHPELTPELSSLIDQWAFGSGFANFFLQMRSQQIGPRIFQRDTDALRALVQLDGELGDNWQWRAFYNYNEADYVQSQFNQVNRSRLQQGLLADPATGQCFDPSNGCVPYTLFGGNGISEEAAQFLRLTRNTSSLDKMNEFGFGITGDLFELPAGYVQIAAGLNYRKNSVENNSLTFTSADVLDSSEGLSGSETVQEAYIEALVPLLENSPAAELAELELGVRYSDYDSTGGVWAYKAGLNWQFIPSFKGRVVFQQAVRTPALSQLYTLPSESSTPFLTFDPCSASNDPVGNGVAELCIAQGVPADQIGIYERPDPFFTLLVNEGGNLELEAEEAANWTAGFVLTPETVDGLSFTADYYDFEIDNAIGALGGGSAFQLCYSRLDPNSEYCQALERDAQGNLFKITNRLANNDLLTTTGIDLSAAYRGDLPQNYALIEGDTSISVSISANRTLSQEFKADGEDSVENCVGKFGPRCDDFYQPKWRLFGSLSYESGPLSLGLSWRYVGKMFNNLLILRETESFFMDDLTAVEELGSYSTFDFSAGFQINEDISARFGINNLFDNIGPVMGDWSGSNTNIDTRFYDAYGRRMFASINIQL